MRPSTSLTRSALRVGAGADGRCGPRAVGSLYDRYACCRGSERMQREYRSRVADRNFNQSYLSRMRKNISTENAPKAIGPYAQAVVASAGSPGVLLGADPARSEDGRDGRRGRRRRPDGARARKPRGGAGGGRRVVRVGREDDDIPRRSPGLRHRQRGLRALSSARRCRRARPFRPRACPRAPSSRSTRSRSSTEGSRAPR